MNIEEFIKKIPFSTGCQVIKFDESGLIAINKKAGRASHPNPNTKANAKPPMVRAAYNFKEEYYSWKDESGDKLHLYLINRLDSPTSGVILASTTKEAADAAKLAFKNKEVIKTYYSISIGKLMPNQGTWIDYLLPTRMKGYVRSSPSVSSGGERAITDYIVTSVDENNANLSLVKLMPRTGLTHQLRVQSAKHNAPILGDATYGNFAVNKRIRSISKINRLFLHCAKTELKIKIADKLVNFSAEAPLPESFDKLLKYDNSIAKNFRPI